MTVPRPDDAPLLDSAGRAAGYCRWVALKWARVADGARAVSLSPQGVLPTAEEVAEWRQEASRWVARAEILEWAAQAPAERLEAVLAQLAIEALHGGSEGRHVDAIVAEIRGEAPRRPDA